MTEDVLIIVVKKVENATIGIVQQQLECQPPVFAEILSFIHNYRIHSPIEPVGSFYQQIRINFFEKFIFRDLVVICCKTSLVRQFFANAVKGVNVQILSVPKRVAQ